MSTLSVDQRAIVLRVIANVRGTGPRAAQPNGTGPTTPGAHPTTELAGRVVSVPRRYLRCIYCGTIGRRVCAEHEPLLVYDPSRAPELYLSTTGGTTT